MAVVVRNKSADLTGAGTAEVNQTLSHNGIGAVEMVLEGKTYHWAPGESKTLSDNLAAEALAASSDLEEIQRS